MGSLHYSDALTFTPLGAHVGGTDISIAVTLTRPEGATKILVQALTQNIRVTLDGTTPTASLGFRLTAGDNPIIIPLGSSTVVKVIQEAPTASIQYQWGY